MKTDMTLTLESFGLNPDDPGVAKTRRTSNDKCYLHFGTRKNGTSRMSLCLSAETAKAIENAFGERINIAVCEDGVSLLLFNGTVTSTKRKVCHATRNGRGNINLDSEAHLYSKLSENITRLYVEVTRGKDVFSVRLTGESE